MRSLLLVAGLSIGGLEPGPEPREVVLTCVDVMRDGRELEPRAMTECAVALDRLAVPPGDEMVLWSAYQAAPRDSFLHGQTLDALLALRLAMAVDELKKAAPPKPAAEGADLFEGARALAKELDGRYLGILEQHQPERGEERFFYEREAEFDQAIVDFLQGRLKPEAAIAEVAGVTWGGTCGMGSDRLWRPQAATIALAALALGRLEDAAAAHAMARVSQGFHEPDDGRDRILLTAAGYDWETVALGRWLERRGSAAVLASHGSERAARWLLGARDLKQWEEGEPFLKSDDYLYALGGLVTAAAGCEDYGTSSSADVERVSGPLPADVEAAALELLGSQVTAGAGLDAAETASHVLVRLCRPESLDSFTAMARSPFEEVRRRGGIGLRALGEDAPEARPNPPVRFRILVDGQPYSAEDLGYSIVSGNGYRRSGSVTARDGEVQLERDPFLDRSRPVTRVELASRPATPAALRFSVGGLPGDLDAITSFSVATQQLTVSCPEMGSGTFNLTTVAVEGEDFDFGDFASFDWTGEPLRFARLQRGVSYELSLYAGGWYWKSEPIVLDGSPVAVDCGESGERISLPFR